MEGNAVHPQEEKSETEIHQAVFVGNKDKVVQLLQAGYDVNACDEWGQPLLVVATARGHRSLVTCLLQQGAKVNLAATANREDSAPSHYNAGKSALLVAMDARNEEMVKILLDHGSDVNFRDTEGRSALHYAVTKEASRLLQLILERQPDIHIVDREGRTALHYAAGRENSNLLQLILDEQPNVNLVDVRGWSSLHLAVDRGSIVTSEILLRHGVDVNLKTHETGRTALHIAAEKGNSELTELLIKQGADINMCDSSRNTSLHLAVEGDHLDMVATLLQQGADLHIENQDGLTPAQLAMTSQKVLALEALLRHAGSADKAGELFLHQAVQQKNLEVLGTVLMFSDDDDIHRKNDKEQSALHTAVLQGWREGSDWLLFCGADPDLENESFQKEVTARDGMREIFDSLASQERTSFEVCRLRASDHVILKRMQLEVATDRHFPNGMIMCCFLQGISKDVLEKRETCTHAPIAYRLHAPGRSRDVKLRMWLARRPDNFRNLQLLHLPSRGPPERVPVSLHQEQDKLYGKVSLTLATGGVLVMTMTLKRERLPVRDHKGRVTSKLDPSFSIRLSDRAFTPSDAILLQMELWPERRTSLEEEEDKFCILSNLYHLETASDKEPSCDVTLSLPVTRRLQRSNDYDLYLMSRDSRKGDQSDSDDDVDTEATRWTPTCVTRPPTKEGLLEVDTKFSGKAVVRASKRLRTQDIKRKTANAYLDRTKQTIRFEVFAKRFLNDLYIVRVHCLTADLSHVVLKERETEGFKRVNSSGELMAREGKKFRMWLDGNLYCENWTDLKKGRSLPVVFSKCSTNRYHELVLGSRDPRMTPAGFVQVKAVKINKQVASIPIQLSPRLFAKLGINEEIINELLAVQGWRKIYEDLTDCWWELWLKLGMRTSDLFALRREGATGPTEKCRKTLRQWCLDNSLQADFGLGRVLAALEAMGRAAVRQTLSDVIQRFRRNPPDAKYAGHAFFKKGLTGNQDNREVTSDLLQPMSERFLLEVASRLSPDHMMLGLHMDLTTADLDNIRRDPILAEPRLQLYTMLYRGRERRAGLSDQLCALRAALTREKLTTVVEWVDTAVSAWLQAVDPRGIWAAEIPQIQQMLAQRN